MSSSADLTIYIQFQSLKCKTLYMS